MQPYQEASEEIQRQKRAPGELLQNVGETALSYTGGGLVARRVLPFLSRFVPGDLAMKGLSKISPSMGKFIGAALGAGQSPDEVKEFIAGKVKDEEKEKSQRNIVQQHDPELHTYIKDYMGKGKSFLWAGQQALKHGRFKMAIDKMKKTYKVPWEEILNSVYGMMQPDERQEQSAQAPPMEQPQTQPQQAPQQQQGAGAAALLATLQNIAKTRQGGQARQPFRQ